MATTPISRPGRLSRTLRSALPHTRRDVLRLAAEAALLLAHPSWALAHIVVSVTAHVLMHRRRRR